MKSEEDRFWAKVERTPDCWLWVATRTPDGYGRFWVKKLVAAHRWAYEHLRSPIPEGMELDHLCRVRWCVNPGHLEPVTRAENNKRSGLAKAFCPNGHPRSGANLTYNSRGVRVCRICFTTANQKAWKAYRERKKARVPLWI